MSKVIPTIIVALFVVTVNVFAQDIFYDSDEPIYYIIEKDGVDYYLFNKPGDATSYDSYYYLFGIEYKDRKNESVYDNEVIQRAIQEGKNKPDKELTALIPSEIKYEDTIYAYDTKSADETVIIQGNLDNDENKEVILVIPTIDKDSKLLRAQFLQIYDRIDDHYKLIKTAHISQYPGVVVLKDLNGDGRQEIVAKGSNGMHLTEAYVYQWQDDNYKQIWHQEGDRGIQLLLDASPPVIKVGMAQWGTSSEPLWEVYQWDKDQFSLKP